MSTWKDIFMDEDAPEQPKVDLPDENEEAGEETPAGAEAAGALSEDGNDPGIKDVPAGEDEITGTKSTEYDDVYRFLDEDSPEAPKVDLPDENEEAGEEAPNGAEAAGALSEDGNDEGIENVPAGEDEITGTKSTEYDDRFSFLDEDAEEPKEGEEAPAEEGDDKGGEGETEEAENKKRRAKKRRRNEFSFFDEDDEKPAEGEEEPKEGEDAPAEEEGGEAENKRRRANKRRRNEWSFFDEDAEAAPAEGEEAPAEGEEPAPEGTEGEGETAENKRRKAGKKRRNAFSFFDEEDEGKGDEQPEDNDEAEGDEDAQQAAENKRRKAGKKRRNEFSFFDEDDEKTEESEGEDKGEDAGEGAGEGGEGDEPKDCRNKKRKAGKKRRNDWSFFDEEGEGDKEEGSDDDGASEKEPTKAPEEEGEEKKDEPATDWASFFDEAPDADANIEEPENVPGGPESVEPTDGQGKEISPIGDPDPATKLTEPILLPVETEDGDKKQITNRKSTTNRYFFN